MGSCCCAPSASDNEGDNMEMGKLNKGQQDVVDSKMYGDKFEYDPMFKGPTKSRSCTDVPFLLVFVFALALHGFVSFFAVRHGNPVALLRPTDSNGRVCGSGPFADKKFLLFFDITQCARMPSSVIVNGCDTPQVCVSRCPSKFWAFPLILSSPGDENAKRDKDLKCVAGTDKNGDLNTLIKEKRCAAYYLPSKSYFGRCIPDLAWVANESKNLLENHGEDLKKIAGISLNSELIQNGTKILGHFFNQGGILQTFLSDIIHCWHIVLVGILVGGALSFFWVMILQLFACLFVYLSLFAFFGLFALSSAYSFYRYRYLAPNKIDWSNLVISKNSQYYLNLKETWLTIFIISITITVVILLILICLCRQINLAVSILGEATKAISANLNTLFFPVVPYVLEFVALAYCGFVAINLASTGTPIFGQTNVSSPIDGSNVSSCENVVDKEKFGCLFVKYAGSDWSFYMQLYNVFIGFWLMAFTVAFGQLVLAGTFASWYWAFDKSRDKPTFPLLKSLYRALRFHIGSMALGSFLIATLKFLRFCLEVLERNLNGSENRIVKYIFCLFKCCFWCLEKVLKFISRNAFIMIAIHGKSFCFAKKDAFFLIMRNCLRIAVLNGVTGFVLFIGKIIVTGSTGVLAFFFFDEKIPYISDYVPVVSNPAVPIFLITFGTYIVASLFFDVFGFAVDTLFLCVMEDLERNDGSPERPYFMSQSLMETLGKRNELRYKKKGSSCLCCF